MIKNRTIMNRLLATVSVLLMSVSALFAQDILITQGGDVIKAYEIEVGPSSVFYKTSEDSQAQFLRINTSELLMIKYKDGTRWVAGDTPASKPDASRDNLVEIDRLNNVDVKYLEEASDTPAKMLFNIYKVAPGSVIVDENVSLRFESTTFHWGLPTSTREHDYTSYEGGLTVFIQNKTNKVVYLDLGNSFFTRGKDVETCYVQSATTTGQTTSTGVAVNVNVSNSKSTTVFNRRIISVPPMSEKEVGKFLLLPPAKETTAFGKDLVLGLEGGLFYLRQKMHKEDIPNLGETKINTDPNYLPFKVFITYSFNEQITNPASLNANLCLDRIIGVKSGMSRTLPGKSLSPNYKNVIFMITNVSNLK